MRRILSAVHREDAGEKSPRAFSRNARGVGSSLCRVRVSQSRVEYFDSVPALIQLQLIDGTGPRDSGIRYVRNMYTLRVSPAIIILMKVPVADIRPSYYPPD